ncbi:MAG: lactate utilization protein [Thermodesulfobacteriota bacterium]|nr:lactate utilization protein [Thermodesulfobacteriota bacterium]
MTQEKRWLYEEHAKRAVTNLLKRNINAQYVSNRKEALVSVLEMIPPGTVVARADSVTIDQIGIMEELRSRNQNKLIDPFAKDTNGRLIASVEEGMRLRRGAFLADIFLTGTNAITLDGKLVSTDGRGNRVAAMIFGPEKVIVVSGVNKIVHDVNQAFQRIRQVAAPMNGRRH